MLPYRAVTSSAMLLAARRFGCRIVATDVGDLGEIIENGVTGMLVPPESPELLAQAPHRERLQPLAIDEVQRGAHDAAAAQGLFRALRHGLQSYGVRV